MVTNPTHEKLAAILAADELTDAVREDLILAFFVRNPLEFAKHLHALAGH